MPQIDEVVIFAACCLIDKCNVILGWRITRLQEFYAVKRSTNVVPLGSRVGVLSDVCPVIAATRRRSIVILTRMVDADIIRNRTAVCGDKSQGTADQRIVHEGIRGVSRIESRRGLTVHNAILYRDGLPRLGNLHVSTRRCSSFLGDATSKCEHRRSINAPNTLTEASSLL